MLVEKNIPMSLLIIWRHFDESRWFLPIHQRKLVWDLQKMKKWHKDIEDIHKSGGGTVEGCVIIYKLPGENKIYLNDGAQRAYWTILKFIDHCKINEIDWKEILGSVAITVQDVEYKNISEAIKGFIQINFGTTATPYELTRTMMCEMLPDFSTSWEPRLNKVQNIVRDCLLSLNTDIEDREDVSKRELSHKRIRDELHLFWKFITDDPIKSTSFWSPQVALSNLKPDQWKKQTKLEKELIESLSNLGLAGMDEKLIAFEKWMKEQTALYQQIWSEIRPPAERPANVHMRWWYTVSMILHNLGRSNTLRDFTEKLIIHSSGRTTLFYKNPEEKQCNCNTAMCNLKQVGMISNIIGFEFPEQKPSRKRKNILLKNGFVNSHPASFALYGDSPTLAENATENRLRSAAPMTDEELQRLKKLNKIE